MEHVAKCWDEKTHLFQIPESIHAVFPVNPLSVCDINHWIWDVRFFKPRVWHYGRCHLRARSDLILPSRKEDILIGSDRQPEDTLR